MYVLPVIILAAITAGIYFLMWRSWNRGKETSAELEAQIGADSLIGDLLLELDSVQYVSTNKKGDALHRVQYPGLRYKGYANIKVLTDGLQITVTGERTVQLKTQQLLAIDDAQMRIGKVVEKGGLAVLTWNAQAEELESSFRFKNIHEQQQFFASVTGLMERKGSLK